MNKKTFYCQYTLLFGILAGLVVAVFVLAGKSFVWFKDGIDQHYPIMVYIHNYIRSFLEGITQGRIILPRMDYRIGQGMDVLTTLNYYGFGDPFLWIAAVFPIRYLEIAYAFLIFLRLYLSGLFFGEFCFSRRQGQTRMVVIGALLYVFSGYALCAGVRHPFFLLGMLFLPLFLIGIERILQERKYGFLVVMVAWSMCTNFYFTYMNTAMMGLYILFRYLFAPGAVWKQKGKMLCKMIGSYLSGILLSGFISVPVILAYLQCSRGGEGGYHGSLLYYDAEFYQDFIWAFIFPDRDIGQWTYLSFTLLGALGVILLFLPFGRKGEKKQVILRMRLGFLVLTGMVCIPLGGKIMNGFAYVCNRWDYAYAMFIAYLVVVMLPEGINRFGVFLQRILPGKYSSRQISRTCSRCLSIVCVALLVWQICHIFILADYREEFIDLGGVQQMVSSSPVQAMKNTGTGEEKSDFYRIEQPWHIGNQSLVLNYYGSSWYYSIIPEEVSTFYQDLEMNTLDRTYSFQGLDSRTGLLSLTAVKYYVTQNLAKGMVPYGFEYHSQIKNKDGEPVFLYQNPYYVPLGYTMDSWMSKSEYDRLGPVEKQEALQQTVVLEDDAKKQVAEKAIRKSTPQITSKVSACQITGMNGMELEDGILKVTEENATMDLAFSSPADCETYLYLKGFQTKYSKKPMQECTVESDETTNYFMLLDPRKNSWYSHENQTVQLGYSTKERTLCRITISSKGTYRLDDIQIISLPMEQYKENMKQLSEHSLKNLSVKQDELTGSISLDRQKLMVFSIPCRRGWSAYVDGKKQELLSANGMYMALSVPEGNHSIRLQYQTPYQKTGILFSVIGALLFLGVQWRQRVKTADRNPEEL